MLNGKDEVVLSDFGLAVVEHTLASLSAEKLAGTPPYMAPEQIQGKPCAASDQYALAVMVYEWLCGQTPFRGSAMALFFQHVHEPPPRLLDRLPEFPQTVEDTVLRALAKDPAQRFACVTDFVAVLERAFFDTQWLSGSVEREFLDEEKTRPLPRSNVVVTSDPKEPDLDDDPTQSLLLIGKPLEKSAVEPEETGKPKRNAQISETESLEMDVHQGHSQHLEERQAVGVPPQPARLAPPISLTRPLPPRETWPDPNRERMLRRLRRSYRDLLTQSLEGITWLELGFTEKPEAVQNVTNLALRIGQKNEQPLPAGTTIREVYEQAEQELLILGEPGAGKSTLLLHLAHHLVAQAEQDETSLLPVILPLSSWGIKRNTLEEWMGEQIALAYDIPRKVSQQWVKQEQILPLLDGLDEMAEGARPACIAAINVYHRAHLTPLVVCSRRAEYEVLTDKERLALQNAVVIRALTIAQVDAVVSRAGESLASLRTAIQTQPEWQELAATPLMLHVLMLTYQGTTVQTTSEEQVWTAYVQRMVERKGYTKRYPLKQTWSWLGWLAHQTRVHSQTVFYVKQLRSDWLPARQQQSFWWATRLPAMLIGICIITTTVLLFLQDGYLTFLIFPTGWIAVFLGIWLRELAVLRHYVIRLLLTISHTFPWRAQRFLDDATARILLRRVGGGYSFYVDTFVSALFLIPIN